MCRCGLSRTPLTEFLLGGKRMLFWLHSGAPHGAYRRTESLFGVVNSDPAMTGSALPVRDDRYEL